MSDSLKDKVEKAGERISEAATRVGHQIGEKVEEAADWTKEKAHQAEHRMQEAGQKISHRMGTPLDQSTGATGNTSDIREHMDVYASCGTFVGRVDHVEGNTIKLTKNDSSDGEHHRIPLSWVAKVHDHIHLDRDHKEVQNEWRPA